MRDISLVTTGVTYGVAEVRQREAKQLVCKLEDEGVVSKLQIKEKGFFSPAMFLKKPRG